MVAFLGYTLVCMLVLKTDGIGGHEKLAYRCDPSQILVVYDKGPHFIKMQCAPLIICGENRGCSPSIVAPSCSAKGSFIIGADQSTDGGVKTTCCQYSSPVKKHKSDECQTYEIHGLFDPTYSNWAPNASPYPNNSNPLLLNKNPFSTPNGPGSPQNPNPNGGGGGGPPPPPAVGLPGRKTLSNNGHALSPNQKDPSDTMTLTLYEAKFIPQPDEFIKTFQRIQNGYRLVICRSKCEETTTTTTTTITSGPTQKTPFAPPKLPGVPLQNKATLIPPPKNGANGSCDMDGQKFLNGLTGGNNGSSGTGNIPGYTKKGTYCEGSKDVGCLSECLRVLQQKYLTAYCVSDNSTCICKQTNDTANFANRLAQQGLIQVPPGCCKQVSPEDAYLINKISKGKQASPSVPPSRKPGTFCKGSTDAGCLHKCLDVLQKHFKSASCEASTSNCICRQSKDTTEFEKNLKAMGINPTNPQCKPVPGAGGMPPPFIPFVGPIPPIGGTNASNGTSVIVKEAENASSSSNSSSVEKSSITSDSTTAKKSTTGKPSTTAKRPTTQKAITGVSEATQVTAQAGSSDSQSAANVAATKNSYGYPTTQPPGLPTAGGSSIPGKPGVPVVPVVPVVVVMPTTAKPAATTAGGPAFILEP